MCSCLNTSTYYRIKDEQNNPEKQIRRKQSDKHLIAQIKQIWQASGCRYGIRKIWHKLKQDGISKLGRCTVERLMKKLGIQGVWRGKLAIISGGVMLSCEMVSLTRLGDLLGCRLI